MKPHKDKGRYLISIAILQSDKGTPTLRGKAIECILKYTDVNN